MTYDLIHTIKKTLGGLITCVIAAALLYRGFTAESPSDGFVVPTMYGLAAITVTCAAFALLTRTEEA